MAQDIWSCPLVRDVPTGWRIVDARISIRWWTIMYIRHIFPCFLWVWRASQPSCYARYTACLSVISWSDFTNMSRSFLSVEVFCKFVEEMSGMATINKPCCCFNSHNADHNSQVAQRYVSIVAHTRHPSPSFFDKAGWRLGVFSFHRLYIFLSVYPW